MRKAIALALALAFALPLAALAPTAAATARPQAAVAVTELTSWSNNGTIDAVSYSPDGKHLAVAIDGGPVQILNSTTFAVEFTFATSPNWVSVSSLSWGPLSDKVGVGYEGGAVAVWRLIGTSTPMWSKPNLNYDVRGVAWSPDGKFLAAGIVHSVMIYWYVDGYLNATIPLDYGGSQ